MDHHIFASPFSWRYGSAEMRAVWSEVHKRQLWRQVWVALARAQVHVGLVTPEQLADLEANQHGVDMARAEAIEAEIHHDLMAEVRTYAEQCKTGGAIIHLGATSADIEDNADAIRLRESLDLLLSRLRDLLLVFARRIEDEADTVIMAFTHLQPAEPTTLGYRLALYGQDLLEDWRTLTQLRASIRGKGIKGAVGTSASFTELLAETQAASSDLENAILSELNLASFLIASQTYPRKQDWRVLSALSGVAASLNKFAFDLRLLQSPVIGEWQEPFGKAQVGSSAMPFKRNPINAEKTNSLARLIQSLASVAWDNAALSLLERTLDDSANRREILPVAFLAVDELLIVTTRLLDKMRIDRDAVARNNERYGLFAALERVMMSVVKAGADRQHIHEHLRELSLRAWEVVTSGGSNPLRELVTQSPTLLNYRSTETLASLLDVSGYVGDAPRRARMLAQAIHHELKSV
ncbi:adenylosuccinate lyase [Anaerolineae bacterium CFX9]|nr:adenylosuccinate lyase [Anaerolineae bacterium CFX9]